MNDDPLIGRQLANFRIEHLIGRGGMAQVYYGWDVQLDRPIAIKVIDIRHRGNPAYAERFVREARMVARWRHENIIQIYYADQDADLYYFVMEYVDGIELGQWLEQRIEEGKSIPTQAVLQVGQAVAAALDYAHEQGVVHRDVKPSNIILEHSGRIVLTDFGLAMDVQQGTMGETFGSPRYIAPEQARNSANAVPQSDIYSLGIVLYEMLTGTVPFDDPSPASLALQHVMLEPPSPRELNPHLNTATEEVLLKALSKEPQARYRSGSELVHALKPALKELQQKSGHRTPLPAASHNRQVPAQEDSPPDKLLFGLTFPQLLIGGGGFAVLAAVILIVFWALGRLDSNQSGRAVGLSTTTQALTAEDSGASVLEAAATDSPVLPTQTTTSETVTSLPPSPVLSAESESDMTAAPPTGTAQTSIPIPSSTPPLDLTPTILYPDGQRAVLYYNADGFYLLNTSNDFIWMVDVSFSALNEAAGESSQYTFSGELWAAYYDRLWPDNCAVLEISGHAPSRPAQCQSTTDFNAIRTPVEGSRQLFWIPREDVRQFMVQYAGEEIGRCEIIAGECEIYLP